MALSKRQEFILNVATRLLAARVIYSSLRGRSMITAQDLAVAVTLATSLFDLVNEI